RSRPPNSPLYPYTTLFRSGPFNEAAEQLQVTFEKKQQTKLVGICGNIGGCYFGSRRGLQASSNLRACALRGERHEVHCLRGMPRSEEHTSELQSRENLVCR